MIKHALIVAFGGAVGSFLRYIIGVYSQKWLHGLLPVGTLSVNLLGSLLIGVIVAITWKEGLYWRLLVAVGFCGGFTTFSTFSLDIVRMWQAEAASQVFLYILISLVGGISLCAFSFHLTMKLMNQL
ncbi:MAG: fluoride efflux transporter CrcB [Cyclobacteriaceae bacterium]|nr:fluoride efflux transporter CrcB [Cyclobacteriaceae bacterium HetDA_MAG_MS6]